VLPLLKNRAELTEKARALFNDLKLDFNTQYDEKDAIGRRYRRQDAIGTPFCVTIDFDTLEDGTVTLRRRDTLRQERLPMEQIAAIIKDEIDMKHLLQQG
jgi:glycyl-tRNA synthetase